MNLHMNKKGFQEQISGFYVFRYVDTDQGPTSLISERVLESA